MSLVLICDADGKTVMELGDANRAGWGIVRLYCDAVMPDVDKFSNEMLDAAADAQQSFAERLAVARKKFHVKYPNGLLPDEMPVEEETVPDAPQPD